MKKYSIILFASALLLLAATSAAQAKPKEVSFRNTKNDTLKLYCQKIGGKLHTTISCNKQSFTPDADWEEIQAEKVCFRHDDGRIRACEELNKIGGTKKGYVCFDLKDKPFPFTPGNEWKRLAYSDKVCGELLHSTVIRHTEMPSLNIEW
jgi:hypothetical protein